MWVLVAHVGEDVLDLLTNLHQRMHVTDRPHPSGECDVDGTGGLPRCGESLASFANRLTSNRANPYIKPGGYNNLKHGLQTFANTPCGAGINATLPPTNQVANDPAFNSRTDPTPLAPSRVANAADFYNRIKEYAFANKSSTTNVPAPPCHKQGNFQSIGRSPQSHPYLQTRREP